MTGKSVPQEYAVMAIGSGFVCGGILIGLNVVDIRASGISAPFVGLLLVVFGGVLVYVGSKNGSL